MFTAIFVFILGLIIGSFLNVVIVRLKAKKQFLTGHSQCPQCGHQLAWLDLIPILSFLFLRGKCHYCKAKISWQYPLMEIATGLIFFIGYWHYLTVSDSLNQLIISYLIYLVFSCFLLIIFVYDLKYYLILDKVSLSALIAAVALNYLLGRPMLNLLLAALLIGGFFLLQFIFSKGKWIGGGDIRLGLVMGAMLGWPMALTALVLAYVIGAVVGLLLVLLKQKSWHSQLPFGAFLAPATWVVYLWGSNIVAWYFKLPALF